MEKLVIERFGDKWGFDFDGRSVRQSTPLLAANRAMEIGERLDPSTKGYTISLCVGAQMVTLHIKAF